MQAAVEVWVAVMIPSHTVGRTKTEGAGEIFGAEEQNRNKRNG
jgi:hypothetical protein